MSRPPNFVIIVADQLRADALGCFGSRIAKTPNIDKLAESGTIFTETYVQNPTCVPSRASFLTGLYTHVRGHRTNSHLLQADEPNLLGILKKAGYYVMCPGIRGDTFAPGVTEQSVHEYGFWHEEMESESNWPREVWRRLHFPSPSWARIEYVGRSTDLHQDLHDELAVRAVERRMRTPPPEPWLLFVPLIAPHCPFGVDEPWFSLHRRADMPPPLPIPAGPEAKFKSAVRNKYGTNRINLEMWRELAAVYHGMVSRMDQHVGRILRSISQSSVKARTVVTFLADHGEYLGDFGLVEKWYSGMDRCLTRTPLIVAGGELPSGQRSEALVELTDLLATVLDLASITSPHTHFGRSLKPLLLDPNLMHRKYVFTEGGFNLAEAHQMEVGEKIPDFARESSVACPTLMKAELIREDPSTVGRTIAVRDDEWTYVWRLYERPELYHRATDPNETVNLAGTRKLRHIERRMEQALLRWRIETADVIPTTENPRFPLVFSRRPGCSH